MPERTVTDATGDRWDVSEQRAGQEEDFRLSFRHQSGRNLEVGSERGVNALSDRELLDMLASAAGDPDVKEGNERSADADGYVTG